MAGPEPVHRSELAYGLGAGAEVVWVSMWIQRRLVMPSYEPAPLRWAYEAAAAWIQQQAAGLVLETEESETPEEKE